MVNWKDIFCRMLRRRHFLLMDGMHSCVYVPRHTYRKLMRLLHDSLRRDPKAENSLRFLWSSVPQGGGYLVTVNPDCRTVTMNCTHGLGRDSAGRIYIPCPYMQQIMCRYGLPPEWCGRVEVSFEPSCLGIAQMRLGRVRRKGKGT